MAIVERDDVIEQLAPASADPAFSETVLPGRVDAGAFGLQAGEFEEGLTLGLKMASWSNRM